MVLHANKRYLDALDMLELASKTQPSNPQVGGRMGGCGEDVECFISKFVFQPFGLLLVFVLGLDWYGFVRLS